MKTYSTFNVTKMKSSLYFFILIACAFLKSSHVDAEVSTFSSTTTSDHDHHIISFVGQKKNKQKLVEPVMLQNKPNAMQNYFERIKTEKLHPENREQFKSDDLLLDEPNTLVNTAESWEDKNKSTEIRRSIPVLEPVRHLLATVRDGGFNHTISKNPHHHLFVSNGTRSEQNESSAIETEEEREMVNGSTELQFLDFAGRFGAKVWGFFTNLQRLFAAGSGSASSAFGQ